MLEGLLQWTGETMGNSSIPAQRTLPPGTGPTPARTPGPTGFNDQGDPELTTLLGSTPGSVGMNDHGDPTLLVVASTQGLPVNTAVKLQSGPPVSVGNKKAGKPKLTITGIVAAGDPLSDGTVVAMNEAAKTVPAAFKHYVAYSGMVKVGGSLAWRANNPGNLRAASTAIASVPGASGHFAVFATMDDGRAAQKNLYLTKYGDKKVRDAINALTPPSENDTAKYLAQLQAAGVDLDKDIKSQIDVLMPAVEANEGMIVGKEVARVP